MRRTLGPRASRCSPRTAAHRRPVPGLPGDCCYRRRQHLGRLYSNYTFEFDTTAWGWIHLILGIIFAIVGFFMFTGNSWARGAGIGLAVVSAVSNFLWLPYFPLWAIVLIVIDVLIIWALATFEPLR